MTLNRDRQPAVRAPLELKMLLSVLLSVKADDSRVLVASVVVVSDCVVGVFLTEKLSDLAPQSFRVKTIVKFSPAGEKKTGQRVWKIPKMYLFKRHVEIYFSKSKNKSLKLSDIKSHFLAIMY